MQVKQVGKQRLVLDLSCRKRDGKYYVVTDRWQRFSELVVDAETLSSLGMALTPAAAPCSEHFPAAHQIWTEEKLSAAGGVGQKAGAAPLSIKDHMHAALQPSF